MNILYITNMFPYPLNSGGNIRAFHMLRYLAGKGEVTLLSKFKNAPAKEHTEALQAFCKKIVLVDRKYDYYFEHFGKRKPLGERVRILACGQAWDVENSYSREFENALTSLAPETFDFVLIAYPPNAQYFYRNKKWRHILKRIIIDIDDVVVRSRDRELSALPFHHHKLRRALDTMFLKGYYRKMNRICGGIVASELDRKYLLNEKMTSQPFLVPNAVEVNGWYEGQRGDAGEPEILYCGALDYPPNEEAVLFFCDRIFPAIKQAIPNAALTVVGRNPKESLMRIQKIPGVSLIGAVESTKPYFCRASIFVVPLLRANGTRVKILEAFSFGKAVVSTSVGVEGLEITDGRHILIEDDPQKFAERCIELLKDVKKRDDLGLEGFKLVREKYSLKTFHGAMNGLLGVVRNENRVKRQ